MASSRRTPKTTQEFLDYRMSEFDERFKTIDQKLDTVIENQRDTVNMSQLIGLEKKFDDKLQGYVTNADFRPYKVIFGIIGTAFLIAVATAFAKVILKA